MYSLRKASRMRRLGRLRAPAQQSMAANERGALGLARQPAAAIDPPAAQPRDESAKALGARK